MLNRILVVDDSPPILSILGDILTAAGYRVITQAFPLANADQVRHAAPDLIILDYWRGSEEVSHATIELIMQSADLAYLPLIICTGYADGPMIPQSPVRRSSVMVLSKPFDVDDLLAVVTITLAEASKHHYDGQ